MNIHDCERQAREVGFDSAKFEADFPAGTMTCRWLDAYMGLLTVDIDGLRNGFLMVRDVDRMFPNLHCYNLRPATDNQQDQTE